MIKMDLIKRLLLQIRIRVLWNSSFDNLFKPGHVRLIHNENAFLNLFRAQTQKYDIFSIFCPLKYRLVASSCMDFSEKLTVSFQISINIELSLESQVLGVIYFQFGKFTSKIDIQ